MRKYFEFYNGAKINCGEAALMTLGAELSYLGCKKPMLLTSSNARKLGAADKVLAALKNVGVKESVTFNALPERPDQDLVKEIKKSYLKKECDGIIAIGGDSAMDSAKCLKLFLSQECEEILPIAGVETMRSKAIPFIAIPTENGTGKEASGYLETDRAFVSTRNIIPDLVIIDEDVTMEAPARIIAAGGVAILANAIESYLGCDEEDPVEIYAEKAIRLVTKNLEIAIKDDENQDASRAIALAGTLAGIAYGNKPYGRAHALAEGLTEITGKSTEEMIAITLVSALKSEKKRYEDRLKRLLLDLTDVNTYAETPDSERAEKAIQSIASLLIRLNSLCNLPTKISQTNIQREQFGAIAEAASNKRSAITSIAPITREDFISLLNESY